MAPKNYRARGGGDSDPDRPRIGLALGGGGARGVAHISVLRVMEELRVPVDCIAGTSMGALVGALYASGQSVDEIEALVLALDWDELFNDSLPRPEQSFRRKRDVDLGITTLGVGISADGTKIAPGILAGEQVILMFERLTQPVSTITDFDKLPIPFRAVAADLNSGDPVVLSHGSLARAMRASMSIPGAFPPMNIDGKILVDGGVARNIPVDVVRNMGADIVIAIDVGTPLGTLDSQAGILAITEQLTGLMTVKNTREQLASLTERDILISPPLGNQVATADFTKGELALKIGIEGVNEVRPQLARYSVSPEYFSDHRAARIGRSADEPVVEFVRLNNNTRYNDDILLARINVPIGQPLDTDGIERDVRSIYGFTTMALVDYDIVVEDGRTGVLINATEKAHGRNYVEVGLSLNNDFAGEFDANLRLGVLISPLNNKGGEARAFAQIGNEPGLLAEYYQPWGAAQRYFFFTRGSYFNREINQFDGNGQKIAAYSGDEGVVTAAFGREFGNYGAILAGLRRGAGSVDVEVGDPNLPSADFDRGEAVVTVTLDRTDSFYFPRNGTYARLAYTASRESLGADQKFDQVDFDGVSAMQFGRHAIQGGLRYHTTISGTAPIQSLYRLGGYTRLVGFLPNELSGQHYGLVFGGYLYELGSFFNRGAYLGGTLEYGNAWQRRSDMAFDDGIVNGSVYVGFDSWIGPMLLGYGLREGGEGNAFLEIGRAF